MDELTQKQRIIIIIMCFGILVLLLTSDLTQWKSTVNVLSGVTIFVAMYNLFKIV